RAAFLGPAGTLARPAAVASAGTLDGRFGRGLDPCAALAVPLAVRPGAAVEVTFLLGEAPDARAARALVRRYRRPGAVARALDAVGALWTTLTDGVQIETPAPALDVMVNGWLPYQTLACRLWGRSALYQSGGAFGFRDQLQDAAALVWLRPELTRAQLLLHAAHQFVEGDVLHWWHPPADRGTRTRFSDDLAWLPWATAEYVRTTGDWGVLDEPLPFVAARPLAPGEDEAYLLPTPAAERADLYTHCCRALDRALTRGAHGLPLMGTGDWNDGMNRVGREGRGESVWLGFFLYHVLGAFLPLVARRGDQARAARWEAHRAALADALDGAGWDGAWYRRAYYDDGTPLGARSGVHQGIRPGDPRERRAVHARRALGRPRARRARPARPRGAAPRDAAPRPPGAHPRGGARVPGGAVRRRRRRLRRAAARRPGRLDVVHGLGGLDVPRRPRVDPRPRRRGGHPAPRGAADPRRVAGIPRVAPAPRPSHPLGGRGREPDRARGGRRRGRGRRHGGPGRGRRGARPARRRRRDARGARHARRPRHAVSARPAASKTWTCSGSTPTRTAAPLASAGMPGTRATSRTAGRAPSRRRCASVS